jgi:hypothetical protein
MMTDQDLINGVKSLADTVLALGGCKNLETAAVVVNLIAALENRLRQSQLPNQ